MKFGFIAKHRGIWPAGWLCEALGVSRGGASYGRLLFAPLSSRCGTAMKDVVTIAPVVHEPGLVAYECPKCGRVTSVLVTPGAP